MSRETAKPEFDHFADSYEVLLKDPMRNRFSGDGAFFHRRKRDLVRDYFRHRRIDTRMFAYLDVGCGRGELASMLRDDFAQVAVCDPSSQMLKAGRFHSLGIDARLQEVPGEIPFGAAQFDLVTAVCVYHHVPLVARAALTSEVVRVLKPGGVFAIIEHNPYNAVTQLIVNRTPVDAGAILLRPVESRNLLAGAGLRIDEQRYFLYFPESVYPRLRVLESLCGKVPLGGQYAIFGVSGISC